MTRWLAWLVACVLLAGLISAGALVAVGDPPEQAVVAVAGDRTGTVGVTSTVTVPITVPPPPAPSTTMRTTTTLSKAAVAVLNAIASTTTTTTTTRPPPPPPATTTTTRAPAPGPTTPTTAPPTPTTTTTTTTTPPTSTTVPAQFTLTIVNNHPRAVVVTVNGREFPLAVDQTIADIDLGVVPAGDVVGVHNEGDLACGSSNSGELFEGGARYRLNLVTDVAPCKNGARPKVDKITRL
ncbi:MAG: hypothetical protein ACR2HM_00140 [Acidimicrobiales bacterium]